MPICAHLLEQDACTDCAPRGAYLPPPEYGPWFPASYRGDCDGCGSEISPGDQIRSDGDGGWLCDICGARGGGLTDVPAHPRYL
jgi:hypothetical protein